MVGKLFHLHQWKAQGKISAMRGFRLGDHTFPFLFKLVVDVLSWLMYTGVGGGGGRVFIVGVDGVQLSHFQFFVLIGEDLRNRNHSYPFVNVVTTME